MPHYVGLPRFRILEQLVAILRLTSFSDTILEEPNLLEALQPLRMYFPGAPRFLEFTFVAWTLEDSRVCCILYLFIEQRSQWASVHLLWCMTSTYYFL